jgi:hypothetical protein
VVVKAVGVHDEVYVDAVWLVEDERAFAVAVISEVELFYGRSSRRECL